MNKQRFKLLFLCTSNSARSIIAEYLVKRFAGDKFDAVSAGASPKPHPNTLALKVLSSHSNIDVSDARSKSWDEFSDVKFDFVITLCDIAPCPIWPGQPIIAHWETPAPSDVEGTEKQKEDAVWKVRSNVVWSYSGLFPSTNSTPCDWRRPRRKSARRVSRLISADSALLLKL